MRFTLSPLPDSANLHENNAAPNRAAYYRTNWPFIHLLRPIHPHPGQSRCLTLARTSLQAESQLPLFQALPADQFAHDSVLDFAEISPLQSFPALENASIALRDGGRGGIRTLTGRTPRDPKSRASTNSATRPIVKMVGRGGFEPPTLGLRVPCSTAELTAHHQSISATLRVQRTTVRRSPAGST